MTIGAGFFDRDATGVDNGTGALFYVNGTHAEAVNEKWSYKLSAGYFAQDALPRPTGTIPNSFNTPYPPYTNSGTSQPKFDARVDYELADSAKLVVLRRRRWHRGHHSQRHRSLRHQQRVALDLLQRPLSEGRPAHRLLHEHPERRRRELSVARGLRRAASAVLRHDNLRHRGVRPQDLRHPSRRELWRQLPPQQLRHLDCARRRRPQRGRRVRAGRDLPQRSVQMGGRRPSGQVLVDRQRGLLAADDVDVQAVAESDGPGLVQPRLPRAILHQQQPRCRRC